LFCICLFVLTCFMLWTLLIPWCTELLLSLFQSHVMTYSETQSTLSTSLSLSSREAFCSSPFVSCDSNYLTFRQLIPNTPTYSLWQPQEMNSTVDISIMHCNQCNVPCIVYCIVVVHVMLFSWMNVTVHGYFSVFVY
jgi:hypothetical protein